MYRVPSSSTPSTPDSRRSSRYGHAPSTTPAGPPPDRSLISSTPAGPPPAATLFGGSQPTFEPRAQNTSFPLFGSSPPKNGTFEGFGIGSIGTSTSGRPGTQRGRTGSGLLRMPQPEPKGTGGDSEEEDEDAMDEDEDEDADEDAQGEDEDEEMDEDAEGSEEDVPSSMLRRARPTNRMSQSVASRTSGVEQELGPLVVAANAKQSQYDLLSLARGITPSLDRLILQESNHVILETERLLEKMDEAVSEQTEDQRPETLAEVSKELLSVWQQSIQSAPGGRASGIASACKLASLILNVHHPPLTAQPPRAPPYSLVPVTSGPKRFTPIPKIMLDWLNTQLPFQEGSMVLKESRGYSRHELFWPAVHGTVLRGNFTQTLQLLDGARFEHADTAQDDGLGDTGYSGVHLRYANEAVRGAIGLLRECPALVSEDWDVKGQDWSIFRHRARQALRNLQELSEGESQNRHALSQSMQAPHFGLSHAGTSFNLSVASRKAESKVPWTIYTNLERLFLLLAGNEETINDSAVDWIDAVMILTIWWSGEEDDPGSGSLAASRRSIMRSQRIRTVDLTPVKAYCQRLTASMATVLTEGDEEFSINPAEKVEVGLACIFDDNIEGLLQILRSWSLPVAAAVAEVARAGGWLSKPDGMMDQFDQSDLMVLSYTEQQHKGVSKDDLLVAYSKLLAAKGELASADGTTIREGWELAIEVLGRLDDGTTAGGRIEKILEQLELKSTERVDKIIHLCSDLGLEKNSLSVALRFADALRADTKNYGDTLLYYARAHAAPKIQEVLRVLVAHCLVHSIAYPPPAELDPSLNALISSPKQTLTKLASQDPEAAQLLSSYLSGYATIRKFYDLRDEQVLAESRGEKPAHRPLARNRAAANALVVIIQSAASSIRGGLYDPDVETVVQVDVLLALFGEALLFVNQPKRTLTLQHLYTLLATIEDLSTAPSMLRSQCEACLRSTLTAAHDPSSFTSNNTNNPTQPTTTTTSNSSNPLLQKSTSNLTTASSQYSLINSTDLGSATSGGSGGGAALSTESSAVLVGATGASAPKNARRGWDWRTMCGLGKNAGADEVLGMLRLGVAREVARAFVEGEV